MTLIREEDLVESIADANRVIFSPTRFCNFFITCMGAGRKSKR